MNQQREYLRYKMWTILIVATCLGLLNFGCKNLTKMPQVKYELAEERKNEFASTNQIDTIIFLTLGSGYLRGSEHNHYTVIKKNDKTIVKRTSNFQKFKPTEISSLSFPWHFLINNYDKLVSDTIKNEKVIVTEAGKILYQQSANHGPTTFLRVKLGETEHEIYLAPLVDSYNIGNINLDLIDKIKTSILTLDYKPSERIRYKWER